MADGHENHGSVRTRQNSRILADSSVNISRNDSGSITLTRELIHEETQIHVNDLIKELSNTSSEAVIRRLAEETTLELNRIRNNMLVYCNSKWPNCPKEKLCRRISRKGGLTAAEKLATDIVLLTKYASSGELSEDFTAIFHKPTPVSNFVLDSLSTNGDSQDFSGELINKVFTMLEEIELKLCEARENYQESTDIMNKEIENLKAHLEDRDSKIDFLEAEIVIVKETHKTDYQLLGGKYDDCKQELDVLKENQTKLEKTHEYLRKEAVQQNNMSSKYKATKETQDKRGPSASRTNNDMEIMWKQSSTIGNPNDFESPRRLPNRPGINASSHKAVFNNGPDGTSSYANVVQSSRDDAQVHLNLICNSDSDIDVNDKESNERERDTEKSQTSSCSGDRPNDDIIHETTRSLTESTIRNQLETDKGQQTETYNNHVNHETEHELELESGFIGVKRNNTKRIYLGGVKEGVDAERIKQFINNKGINPSVVRVLTSKRKGTVAVKINVLTKDFETVLKKEFWPTNVYVRPWYSVNKWSEKLKERELNSK